MPTQQKNNGRRELVEAVQAPIAYFTLSLLVIEAVLAVLAGSGRLSSNASEILVYGIVGSLLLVLGGFLAVLFIKPEVLFRTGPVDEVITAFGRIGDQLTEVDVAILKRMLGNPARRFRDFAVDVMAKDSQELAGREQRLTKLGFVQKVGTAEVQLSSIGAGFIHTISRYATNNSRDNSGFPLSLPRREEPSEIAATEADLIPFLRGLDLKSVKRLMVIANTGQETVRVLVDELERLKGEQTFERFSVHILLRSPSLTDQRRAYNAAKTISYSHRLSAEATAASSIDVEVRFYAGPVPLRCVLVEFHSGAHAGFLSFYEWHQQKQRIETSTRDAASKRARIVPASAASPALDSYLSWFSHFWGAHKLRTIIFDFDDTLFSTTEPQISAWLLALKAAVDRGHLKDGDLAPGLLKVWHSKDDVRTFIRDVFFHEQSEEAIFAALVPHHSKRQEIFEFVRQERHRHRHTETLQDAQLVPNISPAELARLSTEYSLVIVSATDEQLIDRVLERWSLKKFFPYVVGRAAPQQDWFDTEGKSQNLIRVTHMLGVPLERIVFVGDSDADYRSARQLGIRFIENRFNADFYRRPSLIRGSSPKLDGVLSRESKEGELTRLLGNIEALIR